MCSKLKYKKLGVDACMGESASMQAPTSNFQIHKDLCQISYIYIANGRGSGLHKPAKCYSTPIVGAGGCSVVITQQSTRSSSQVSFNSQQLFTFSLLPHDI